MACPHFKLKCISIQEIEQHYKNIEGIINTIRLLGRETYRKAYRKSPQDIVFRVIEHESVDSNFIEGFPKWKSKLNTLLI